MCASSVQPNNITLGEDRGLYESLALFLQQTGWGRGRALHARVGRVLKELDKGNVVGRTRAVLLDLWRLLDTLFGPYM